MKRPVPAFFAIAFLVAIAATAVAHDYRVGDLRVNHPWARASTVRHGAVYMAIENEGDQIDRLVQVSSPVAKKAQLHTHLIEEGVVMMRPVEAVEVHPGEPSVLRPGGIHVMLIGLGGPLREGDLFLLTLPFEKAGSVVLEVIVDRAGSMGPHGGVAGHNHLVN